MEEKLIGKIKEGIVVLVGFTHSDQKDVLKKAA